jgi:hypothetical protein
MLRNHSVKGEYTQTRIVNILERYGSKRKNASLTPLHDDSIALNTVLKEALIFGAEKYIVIGNLGTIGKKL